MDRFEAVEVHRTEAAVGSPLTRLVPKGGAYGYDLIAYVGCETFLRGRKLQSVAREFPQIPFSSLYDVQHKVLFYFGHLHRQSAPVRAARFGRRGGGTWLIDATIEPDTPMYFGIYEAQDNVLLDAYRIPSENADAITPCLEQTDWLREHIEHTTVLAEVLAGKRVEVSLPPASWPEKADARIPQSSGGVHADIEPGESGVCGGGAGWRNQ